MDKNACIEIQDADEDKLTNYYVAISRYINHLVKLKFGLLVILRPSAIIYGFIHLIIYFGSLGSEFQ